MITKDFVMEHWYSDVTIYHKDEMLVQLMYKELNQWTGGYMCKIEQYEFKDRYGQDLLKDIIDDTSLSNYSKVCIIKYLCNKTKDLEFMG